MKVAILGCVGSNCRVEDSMLLATTKKIVYTFLAAGCTFYE